MRRLLPLIAPILLLLAGLGLLQVRKAYIRSFFVQGEPALPEAVERDAAKGVLRPARVLLVDGLSEVYSRGSPAMNRLCAQGLDLRLDVGFPSVSLPVQHVLWTGTWQHESGVQFVVKKLTRPALPSLPGEVRAMGGEASALVQHHPWIAGSFPFSSVVEASDNFSAQALEAWRSGADLVFIHHLAVDDAGHRSGAASPAYAAAARAADTLLGKLHVASPPGATLVALSDHGHLPGTRGGHGGAELGVRLVRACVTGAGIPAGSRAEATLVDLTALLAGQLGLPPLAHCRGVGLHKLLQGHAPRHAPLPGPRPWAVAAAITLAAALLILWGGGIWRAQRRATLAVATLPWGVLVSLVLIWFWFGPPTLSSGIVFQAEPWAFSRALWPALLLPGVTGWWLDRGGPRLVGGLGLLWPLTVAPALLALGLTGFPLVSPPLLPGLTALASLLLLLSALGLFAQGGVGLVVRLLLLDGRRG